MSTFEQSYIETALWSSTDFDGTPFDDRKYADVELAEETRKKFAVDCETFQVAISLNGFDLSTYTDAQLAHDFWLTRNHHGAGFWDGDYPEAVGMQLTKIAHNYGVCELYVGDDGKIYAS